MIGVNSFIADKAIHIAIIAWFPIFPIWKDNYPKLSRAQNNS